MYRYLIITLLLVYGPCSAQVEVFPDAKIVAHSATLNALKEEWQAMEDQRRESYKSVDVEELRRAADGLEDSDPDTVFEDNLVYDFGDRSVHVKWMGRGNTDGDIVVWLPDDRVLVSGDMLVAPIPYAFDSPMLDWAATLERIAGLDAAAIIPGHGPVLRDKQYLARVQSLLKATVNAVREAHDDGVAYTDLPDAVDLTAYEGEFTNDDPEHAWAWHAYFVDPGIGSAWSSLGYPVPDD